MRLLFSLSAAIVLAAVVLTACNSKDGAGSKESANAVARNSPANSAGNRGGLAASPPSQSAQNIGSDGVRRVTTVELRDAVDKGTALIIDTRSAEAYQQDHIKGSINIPVDQVASRLSELPRDKMIVAYCS